MNSPDAMAWFRELRDPGHVRMLSKAIAATQGNRRFSIMEVCGGQTHTIYKYRLRDILPEGLRLVSGPGCPVCVTPVSYIDRAVCLGLEYGAVLYTFGDLMRVPGSRMSLEQASAAGAEVRPVYSPLQAVDFAREHPSKPAVFLGIGFETTLPGIGLALKQARGQEVDNFSVLLSAKRVPPVLEALLRSGKAAIDGFITPGHVTAVIGADAYAPLVERYQVPMVVGGFEPVDLLYAIHLLVDELANGRCGNLNAYARAARPEGNRSARQVIEDVFEEKDDELRGLGWIPNGGYGLKSAFAVHDAECRFDLQVESSEPEGCLCGAMLCGTAEPSDCPLFGCVCTPASPVGSCMVSNEGVCNAVYVYASE